MQNELLATARSYIGTRFHHQGRLKGKGIDCLGLLVCVAQELSLVARDGSHFSAADKIDYSHQPDTQALRNTLDGLLWPLVIPSRHPAEGVALAQDLSIINDEILRSRLRASQNDSIKPADIALFSIQGMPQHMGIISDFDGGLGLIHAYAPAKKVVEHALDDFWCSKMVCAYRVTSEL